VTTYLLVSNTLAFVVNVVANLALIPPYGLVGAAVASAPSLPDERRRLGVLIARYDISPFSSWSIRTYLVLPVVMFPLAYASSQVVTLTAVTLVPFLVVVGLVTVAVVSVAGCLQPED